MNKVQKLLLACLASSALLPSMAIANTVESTSGDSEYYLTFGAGAFQLNKSSGAYTGKNPDAKAIADNTSYKKPKMGYEFMVGAGYNIAEGVRLELVFIKPMVGDTKVSLAGNGGTSGMNALELISSEPERTEIKNLQYQQLITKDENAQAAMRAIGAALVQESGKQDKGYLKLINNRYNFETSEEPKIKQLTAQEKLLIYNHIEKLRDLHVTKQNPDLAKQIEVNIKDLSEDEETVAKIKEKAEMIKAFMQEDLENLYSEVTEILGDKADTNGSKDNNNGKITAQINSVQLRAYVDVFDIADYGKAYVGAGLGWAHVKAKCSFASGTEKTKNKNNLAWFVGLGAAFNVADGTRLAVEYNYQDFGNAKFKDGNKFRKKSFAGHALIAKLMFDI